MVGLPPAVGGGGRQLVQGGAGEARACPDIVGVSVVGGRRVGGGGRVAARTGQAGEGGVYGCMVEDDVVSLKMTL